jgi:Prp8 binding protein
VGTQVRKYGALGGVVNSVRPMHRGAPMFVSGSDDRTVKLWDLRLRRPAAAFEDKFAVTAVAFSDAGDEVYSGGLDNAIKVRVRPLCNQACYCTCVLGCALRIRW